MSLSKEELEQFARDMGVPPQQLLDPFTRTDELMLLLIKTIRDATQVNQLSIQALGGATNGGVMIPSVRNMSPEALKKLIESGSWVPYDVHSVPDISTASSGAGVEVVKEGDYVSCWTNGSYGGIGVRFNNPNAPIVYFNHFNPIRKLPFSKLYLNYTAQPGKACALFIGRQQSAEGMVPPNSAAFYPFQTIASDKDSHFAGAIAQYATEEENLTGLIGNKIKITGVSIQSDQALDYRLILFSKDSFADTDLDSDKFIGELELDLPSYGFRIAGANQYYMAVTGLNICYEDEDETNEIHVALQNLSATGKNAGATGEVKVLFTYEER